MFEILLVSSLIFLVFVAVVCVFMLIGINTTKAIKNPKEVVKGQGDKKALLLYQPSRHSTAKNITESIADTLVAKGYQVTINFPSAKLNYNLDEFDFLGFGSPVYVGRYSEQLKLYLSNNKFKKKKVLVYAIGTRLDDTDEIDSMYDLIDSENEAFKIKVSKNTASSLNLYVEKMIELG